jgi:hypothetical protein
VAPGGALRTALCVSVGRAALAQNPANIGGFAATACGRRPPPAVSTDGAPRWRRATNGSAFDPLHQVALRRSPETLCGFKSVLRNSPGLAIATCDRQRRQVRAPPRAARRGRCAAASPHASTPATRARPPQSIALRAVTPDCPVAGIGGNQADNSASFAGAVYEFTRSGTTWSQQDYIKASNTNGLDQFGTSIALSSDGSTLAVGASWESSAATGIGGNQADNSAARAGAVYGVQ